MKDIKPKTIEEYINAAPQESQEILYKLLEIIQSTVPSVEGGISWNVITPPSTSSNSPLSAIGLHQKQTYEKSKSTTNGSGSSFLQVQRP